MKKAFQATGIYILGLLSMWMGSTFGGNFTKAFVAAALPGKEPSTQLIKKVLDSIQSDADWRLDENGDLTSERYQLVIKPTKKEDGDIQSVALAYMNAKMGPPKTTKDDRALLKEAYEGFAKRVEEEYLASCLKNAPAKPVTVVPAAEKPTLKQKVSAAISKVTGKHEEKTEAEAALSPMPLIP